MTAKYVLDEIEKCIPEWPFQFVCAGFFEVRDKVWKLRKQLEEEEKKKTIKEKNINSPEEECNTVYKDITMIDKDGNRIKAIMEQREKI